MLDNKTKAQIIRYLLVDGMSNREIARQCGCSETTVRRFRGRYNKQSTITVHRGNNTQLYRMKARKHGTRT